MKRSCLLLLILLICPRLRGQSFLEDTYFTVAFNNYQHGSIIRRPVGDILSFDAPSFSLGIEKYLSSTFDVSGTFSMGEIMNHGVGISQMLGADLGLKYKLNGINQSALKPYFSLGLGMRLFTEDNAETSTQAEVNLTPELGLDMAISDKLKFSISVAYNANGSIRYREYGIGLGFSISRKKDSDGDGIRDKLDRCPEVAGFSYNGGCPNPDTDQDGVEDHMDKCPNIHGQGSITGCPEVDAVADSTLLSSEPASVPTHLVSKDPANIRSGPDQDQDLIADIEDACPALKGNANNKGCPFHLTELLLASDIYFAPGEDELSIDMRAKLDRVVKLMSGSQFRIVLTAFSNESGTETLNKMLSQQRAESVFNYLTGLGISTHRISISTTDQMKHLTRKREGRRVELAVNLEKRH